MSINVRSTVNTGEACHLPLGENRCVVLDGNIEPHVNCTSRIAVKEAWLNWALQMRPQIAFTPTFKMREFGEALTPESVRATVDTFVNGLTKRIYTPAQIKKKMRASVFLKEEGTTSSFQHRGERYHCHGVIAGIPDRYDLSNTFDQLEIEGIIREKWLSRPFAYNDMKIRFLIEDEDYEFNVDRWIMYTLKNFSRDASDGIYINQPKN